MNTNPDHSTSLAERLATGDESAFAALLESLGPRLRRAARRMLRSAPDADDAVQECFVDLVRGRRHLRGVHDLNGYVFRVLYRATGRIKKRRPPHGLRADALSRVADPDAMLVVDAIDNSDELELAIQTLPPQQRDVLVLRTDAGMTFQEIGKLLGVSINTAASRYRYAIEKLRVQLVEKSCEMTTNNH